jgi:outer membrane protein assembly factor BamB
MTLSPLPRRLSQGIALAALVLAVAVGWYLLPPAGSLPLQAGPRRDWPLFGGTPSRNQVNPFAQNIPGSWKIEWEDEGAGPGGTQDVPRKVKTRTNIKWVARLGSVAYGGVVVADGKVFIGTNNEVPRDPAVKGDKGVLMCFREADGAFLGQVVHDKLSSGRVNDWPLQGIPSMPAVEGDRLYYVSNRCELVCAAAGAFRGGKHGVRDARLTVPADAVLWRLDMIKELGVFPHNLAICSPLVVGDLVFVVTGNGVDESHVHIPAPGAPSFLAVHKHTGRVAWQNNAPTARYPRPDGKPDHHLRAVRALMDRGELLAHGQWSNPAYAEVNGQAQVIFPGGDGWLYAFAPKTGELLWKFDGNPKGARFANKTRNDFIATPVAQDGKLYVGVGQDPGHGEGVGHLWCVDLARALARGRTNPGRDVSPVHDNFNPKDPVNRDSALHWHYGGPAPRGLGRRHLFGRTLSTCAVHDGLVYAADLGGYLHCLDAETGRRYWDHSLQGDTWGSPYWADGKVFLGNEEGEVFVFAHGRKKILLARVDMGEPIRGMPVAANGVLYVVTRTHLFAIAPDPSPKP